MGGGGQIDVCLTSVVLHLWAQNNKTYIVLLNEPLPLPHQSVIPKIANEFSRKVKTIQFGVMFVVSSVDSVDAAHGLTV